MNLYNIIKIFGKIKSKRIKLFAIYLMHIMHRRYIGIYIDPVLGCNYRCQMCYFSDENTRKNMHGKISEEDLEKIARALFHRALKLQIGCGAEPTIANNIEQTIRLGKKYSIPYISVTTNGKLVTKEKLISFIESGLNEITISAHGLKKDTYERLMGNGDYDHFIALAKDFAEIKEKYPSFKIRINYTMNEDNTEELLMFNEIFKDIPIDLLQLRPIQKIGESEYNNFELTKIEQLYDSVIVPLIKTCKERGTICIAPEKANFTVLENQNNENNIFEELTYCYVSPKTCWRDDFDFRNENFESYSRKHKTGLGILKKVFDFRKNRKDSKSTTIKMNYKVQ